MMPHIIAREMEELDSIPMEGAAIIKKSSSQTMG